MSEPAPPPRLDADAVYEDFVSRREAGEPVDLESLCRTHPDIAAELRKRESARALLDQLFPGCLSGDRADAGGGASVVDDSAGDSDGGTIQELLARLHSVGPRGSRYRVVNEIARGGMGIVLRVVDTELRRKLAMKVARAHGVVGDKVTPPAETRALDRFLQEAQITSQLDHPGVVPVYEIGIGDDGRVFFTMRYVRGQTLKEVFELARTGAEGWTQLRAVNVLLRVCETMSYAHDRSTVHRDLKPANIMVGRFGEVYVMDWGLARVIGRPDAHAPAPDAAVSDGDSRVETLREDERDATPDSPRLTVDGEVLGTPAYMAPEQAGGEHDRVGPRSDVYAIGAMLYHLIAGEMPYVPAGERLSSHAVRLRVIAGPPRPLHEYGRKSPPALVAVCEKAMSRRLDERYADMRELASDLRAYVEGRVVAAYETGSWAETKMWVRRNKALAGVLAGVVAAVLLVALVTYWRGAELRRIEGVRQAVGALRQFEREEGDLDFGRQLASSATWWCDQVDALLASRTALRVEAERLRSLVQISDVHRARATADFTKVEELTTKREILQWRRRMLGEEPWPKLADVQARVDHAFAGVTSPEGLRAINSSVFRYVRPDEPRIVGDEVFACALAERLVKWPDASMVLPTYRDTYAFALFRVGECNRALGEQQSAVAEQQGRLRRFDSDNSIPESDKQRERNALRDLSSNLNILTQFREEWRDIQRQRRLTDDLAAEVATMAREIEDEAWALALGAQGSWYRDVAQTLRRLDQLERRRDNAHRAMKDAPGAQAWQRAIKGVATAPNYGGIVELTPQIDLMPLGQDPESQLWEFLHLPSGVAPRRGPNGRFVVGPETGIVFVLLPGGKVPLEDRQTRKPVHDIMLDPFFLSKYELTEQQWARIGGGWSRSSMVDSPVRSDVLYGISWFRATAALAEVGGWLSLPTGAQWEFGCRAGTTTRWWTGDRIEDLKLGAQLNAWVIPGRCGMLLPNRFGLHDTLGLAAEWCVDGPDDNRPARDRDGLRSATDNRRWLRGGDTTARPIDLGAGFQPARHGEEDLDGDGDCDLIGEGSREVNNFGAGARPMRPLLR